MQARKGSKAVAETIVKTIIRDASLLNVGDVWVADGHNLAFDIMNPKTGKAQRMTMIMVFDWASRYPVGATLAFNRRQPPYPSSLPQWLPELGSPA